MQNTYIELVTIEDVLIDKEKLPVAVKKCPELNVNLDLEEIHPMLGPAPDGFAWLKEIKVLTPSVRLEAATLGAISQIDDLAEVLAEIMTQGTIEIYYDNDYYGPGAMRVTPGKLEDFEMTFEGSIEKNLKSFCEGIISFLELNPDLVVASIGFLKRFHVCPQALAEEILRTWQMQGEVSVIKASYEALLKEAAQRVEHLGFENTAKVLKPPYVVPDDQAIINLISELIDTQKPPLDPEAWPAAFEIVDDETFIPALEKDFLAKGDFEKTRSVLESDELVRFIVNGIFDRRDWEWLRDQVCKN